MRQTLQQIHLFHQEKKSSNLKAVNFVFLLLQNLRTWKVNNINVFGGVFFVWNAINIVQSFRQNDKQNKINMSPIFDFGDMVVHVIHLIHGDLVIYAYLQFGTFCSFIKRTALFSFVLRHSRLLEKLKVTGELQISGFLRSINHNA